MNARRFRTRSIAAISHGGDRELESRLLLSALICVDPELQRPGRSEPLGGTAARAELTAARVAARPRPAPAPINGARAFEYLKQITALGPRPAGSTANALQRQLVAQQFAQNGGLVRLQPFAAVDPLNGNRVEMANLVGSWRPERSDRVLLAAHYDTRPFADQEPDPAQRNTPYLGANDGASGVAMLMEIANHLRTLPTNVGVDLVLFDGEELVYQERGEYFLGSKEFVRVYHDDLQQGTALGRYKAALVLDMVGGKNLQLKKEPYSLSLAPQLVQEVWGVARRLRAPAFTNRVGRAVMDDHLPLNYGGIPAIDLIDFDYPYWHKAQDLPEKTSPASFRQVGRVVTAWLSQQSPA